LALQQPFSSFIMRNDLDANKRPKLKTLQEMTMSDAKTYQQFA